MLSSTLTLAVSLLLLKTYCECFMLDLKTAHIYNKNSEGSIMFGYSMAFLNDSLLVGAPKLNTSNLVDQVYEPGGLFSCKMSGSMACSKKEIDTFGDNIASSQYNFQTIEEKSHQWLGSSLYANPKTGVVSTCAPFYVYKGYRGDKKEPVGKCFYSKDNATTFDEISPCKDFYMDLYREIVEREDITAKKARENEDAENNGTIP